MLKINYIHFMYVNQIITFFLLEVHEKWPAFSPPLRTTYLFHTILFTFITALIFIPNISAISSSSSPFINNFSIPFYIPSLNFKSNNSHRFLCGYTNLLINILISFVYINHSSYNKSSNCNYKSYTYRC